MTNSKLIIPAKPSPVQKARMLLSLNGVKIIQTDSKDRTKNALVSGSEAKTYDVILHRTATRIQSECYLITNSGTRNCKGNYFSICYHSIATLLHSAKLNGWVAAVCNSMEDATKRKNLGGTIFELLPRNANITNRKTLYFVVNKK